MDEVITVTHKEKISLTSDKCRSTCNRNYLSHLQSNNGGRLTTKRKKYIVWFKELGTGYFIVEKWNATVVVLHVNIL